MNTNRGHMLGDNRHPSRKGFYCNCVYCHDGDMLPNKVIRKREKEFWRKDVAE